MKIGSPLLAAGLLGLGTAGLLHFAQPALTEQRVRDLGQQVLEAQVGDLVQLQTPEATATAVAVTPAPSPSPEPVPVETVEEAWDEIARETEYAEPQPSEVRVEADVSLEIRNETDYAVDFTQLPPLPEGLDLNTEGPVVLIMHTHGSEGYTMEEGQTVFRTQDETKSVMAVGQALAEVLEQRGYGVVHDQTLCDYPEYTGAYNRSRQVIQQNLEAYPSIVLVLDIHRDAVEDGDGNQMRMACTVDGAEVSRLMLVVGSDAGGLEHPQWRENLSLAAVLQARMNAGFPGIMRPLNLRRERFNQDLGAMSLLVEVGASGNALTEAEESARRLGGALSDVLDQYSGKIS